MIVVVRFQLSSEGNS